MYVSIFIHNHNGKTIAIQTTGNEKKDIQAAKNIAKKQLGASDLKTVTLLNSYDVIEHETALTAFQMNKALHCFRNLSDASDVLIYLDNVITSGTENDYEADLERLMKKGAKCYYEVWEKAKKYKQKIK